MWGFGRGELYPSFFGIFWNFFNFATPLININNSSTTRTYIYAGMHSCMYIVHTSTHEHTIATHAGASAGSIPDSYDIYRYLNLVRYSIFDTRYFRRKCNFVDIFRSYLKRLRHVHLLFFKKLFCYETFRGKRNPDFFSSKIRFFFSKIRFFSENIQNSGGCPLPYTTFRKHRNPVFGHFPSFPASAFMPRLTYFQYLTQCGVNPGLYSVRRSTQTELRKTNLRRYARNVVYTPA